jgi:hypothetical protein
MKLILMMLASTEYFFPVFGYSDKGQARSLSGSGHHAQNSLIDGDRFLRDTGIKAGKSQYHLLLCFSLFR